ncbi:MAG: hypothetical protein ACXABY_04295 [Candidatus Thorarchaeota archaeon]|jgi:hypothetical protein
MCLTKLIDPPENLGNKGWKVFQICGDGLIPCFSDTEEDPLPYCFEKEGWNEDTNTQSISTWSGDPTYPAGFHLYLKEQDANRLKFTTDINPQYKQAKHVVLEVEFDDVVAVGEGSRTPQIAQRPQTTVVVARRIKILQEVSKNVPVSTE